MGIRKFRTATILVPIWTTDLAKALLERIMTDGAAVVRVFPHHPLRLFTLQRSSLRYRRNAQRLAVLRDGAPGDDESLLAEQVGDAAVG